LRYRLFFGVAGCSRCTHTFSSYVGSTITPTLDSALTLFYCSQSRVCSSWFVEDDDDVLVHPPSLPLLCFGPLKISINQTIATSWGDTGSATTVLSFFSRNSCCQNLDSNLQKRPDSSVSCLSFLAVHQVKAMETYRDIKQMASDWSRFQDTYFLRSRI
jgi:hypothetical protein